MFESDTDMMGSKENRFTQQPIGMSPRKPQHIKANSRDTGLLHKKEVRWKKQTSPESNENSISFAFLPQTRASVKRS